MFRMGTESFNLSLKLPKLLKPSSSMRRSTRSSTNDWEIPKSSKLWGILGANPVRMGASVAAMVESSLTPLIGRYCQLFIHTWEQTHVRPLVKFCGLLCGLLLAGAAWGAASPEQIFLQAQKAEHAGQTVRAYLLYAQAAAADPSNLAYCERAQALRPMASLMKASQPTPSDLAPDKIDRTLFGSIPDQDLEQARKPLPPPTLKAAPGRQDFDLKGDSKAL